MNDARDGDARRDMPDDSMLTHTGVGPLDRSSDSAVNMGGSEGGHGVPADDGNGPHSPPKMRRQMGPAGGQPSLAAAATEGETEGDDQDRESGSILNTTAVASSIRGTRFLSEGGDSTSAVDPSALAKASAGSSAEDGSELDAEGDDIGEDDNVMELSAENLERISPAKPMGGLLQNEKDDDKSSDANSAANSMTSHMGSDVGMRKLRLDEVNAMEVMEEEDEEDEEQSQRGESSALKLPENADRIDLSLPVLLPGASQTSNRKPGPRQKAPPSNSAKASAAIHHIGTGLSKSIGGRIAPSSPRVNLSPRANAATVPLTGILRSPTRTAPPTLSPFRRTSPTKSPSSQPPLSPSPRVRASVSFEESPPASPSVGRHLYASQKRYAHKRSKSLDNDPMVGIASRLPARRSLAPAASSRVSRSPGQYSPISYGGISVASAGGAFRQGGPAQYVRHQRPTGSIERPSPTTHISPAAPQRVEVEREDAVDLLTCLVQRSIAFQKTADSKDDDLYPSKSGEEEQGTSVTKGKKALRGSPRGTSISGLEEAIGALRRISETYEARQGSSEDNSSADQGAPGHDSRMKVIDGLLQSHTYAVEQSTMATSAAAWLKSIGRSDSGSPDADTLYSYSDSDSEEDDADGRHNKDDNGPVAKVDNIALRARLHTAESEIALKIEQIQRLDEELAKCKEEIGRVKSTTSRAEAVFTSPNRSIFDVDEDGEGSSTDEDSWIGDTSYETERNLKDVSAAMDKESENTKEIILLKVALEEANAKLLKVGFESNSSGPSDKKKASSSSSENQGAEEVPEGKMQDVKLVESINEKDEDEDTNAEEALSKPIPRAILSNPALEEDLENYKNAIRSSDLAKITLLKKELKAVKSKAVVDQEGRSFNARVLNEENFVTEWEVFSPLPPPPEHALRSPIVYELLSSWTSDRAMQESLLTWAERILEGEDPSTVPPLKISSLDHRLRDGFTLHILPLLLRRSDIHVEATTRAHRRTSYDMAVTVSKAGTIRDGRLAFGAESGATSPSSQRHPSSKHLMAYRANQTGQVADEGIEDNPELQQHVRNRVSAFLRGGTQSNNMNSSVDGGASTNASDVTNRISNLASTKLPGTPKDRFDLPPRPFHGPPRSSLRGDEVSVLTHDTRAGVHQSQQPQGGLMGRALGMFGRNPESPRLGGDAHSPPRYITQHDRPSSGAPQMPSLSAVAEGGAMASSPQMDEEYHRVVSAPPGKIGMTFVQYRGHAMVSDVVPESPLNGWVFPSDIVIAVDEVPVSGLRVREIVELLKIRKDRQRALRVISSHAMQQSTSAM